MRAGGSGAAAVLLLALLLLLCLHGVYAQQQGRGKGGTGGKGGKGGRGGKGGGKGGEGGGGGGGGDESGAGGALSERAAQKQAMEQWAASLIAERDYSEAQWRVSFHTRSPSEYFDRYCQRLSKLFKSIPGATVNFAMIGACDGTNDPTIRERYLPNSHWRGVFVEPMSNNYADLVRHLEEKGAGERSLALRGAATSTCSSPTIMVERPLYEEKNKSLPHWLRRQIGSIVPDHRIAKAEKQGKELQARARDWTLEAVSCLTASDILLEWGNATSSAAAREKARGKGRAPRRRRPHVLKIDVEGHDYDVLLSFVRDVPNNDLPLLIEFEAKSIGPKFPAARETLEQRGYVVSNFSQDGFALLKADSMFGKQAGGVLFDQNSVMKGRRIGPPKV